MNQSDLPLEVVLHRIGDCPICGKGKMLQGSAGWTCDYFVNLREKCTFTIFSKYQGYQLTEEDAVDLITKGECGPKQFFTMSGKPFTAMLKRIGEKIKVVGENAVLSVPCPICGGKVKELQKGYACENFFQEGDTHCPIWVSKEICGRQTTAAEVETLLERGYTEVLDGFMSNGKPFSSCLVIDPRGDVVLKSDICPCPKCGTGRVFAGIKAFNCSNYRDPSVRCDFVIWRNTSGHRMLVDEVRCLCQHRQTPLLTFYSKEGMAYNRHLIINEDGNVKLV